MTVRHPINRGALKAYTLRTSRTAAEIAAGVTPVDDNYEPGNVLRYGANTTPGTTNMTTAIQSAIDSGSNVLVPPGTYACDALTLSGKTDLIVQGYGATIRWRNQGVNEVLAIGGTSSNIVIEGLTFKGDDVATASPYQIGINMPNLATTILDNIKISKCRFENLTQGVGAYVSTLGTIKDLTVEGCSFYEMAGVIGGTGYGVSFNMGVNDNATPGRSWKVLNNDFENTHRHAIYYSESNGGLIQGNSIKTHRNGDGISTGLAAIMIARGVDVECCNNIIEESEDMAIIVAPSEEVADVTENINIHDNLMIGSTGEDMRVGAGAPATNGPIKNVTIHNNYFIRSSATNFDEPLEIWHCLGLNVTDNKFISPLTFASIFHSIDIICSTETSGTSLYTDNLYIARNVFVQDGTNPRPIKLTNVAADSGVQMRFDSNIFTGTGGGANEFYIPQGTHTNTNITVIGQRSRGLTEGDWNFPKVKTFGTSDATPSVLRGNLFQTADTTTITDFDDGVAGQRITVWSLHSMSFDVTGTNLVGGTVDIATTSGDITEWATRDGTTWVMTGFMDASVDNSAGA